MKDHIVRGYVVVVCIPDRGDRKDRSLRLIVAYIPDRGDRGLS